MATQKYAKSPFSPTRFPAGVNNSNEGTPLSNYAVPDPSKLQTTFDDFNLGLGGWTAVTTAGAAGPGGLALITAAGSLRTPQLSYVLTAGKRAFVKARFSVAGLTASVITGFFDAVLTPTTGVYVTVANNTMTLTVGATTTAAVPVAYTVGQMIEVGIEITPREGVKAFFNDGIVASSLVAVPQVNLAFGISAATANATVDYLLGAVER